MDSRCKLCIVMGKVTISGDTLLTGQGHAVGQGRGRGRHDEQTMVLVPMDSAGLRIVRSLNLFGYDDAPR